MHQDVRQWIEEIQILQQKLTEAHQERDEAFSSAAKWRNLYETEAKQRRTDANLAKQSANALRSELRSLQELHMPSDHPNHLPEIQAAVDQIQDITVLQAKLAQALLESDRLTHALKAEQSSHTETRKALTTALGDTVDRLTQERAHRQQEEKATVQRQTVFITHETVQPALKSPLLALPSTDLEQSPS
jgi:hypothetical protein